MDGFLSRPVLGGFVGEDGEEVRGGFWLRIWFCLKSILGSEGGDGSKRGNGVW